MDNTVLKNPLIPKKIEEKTQGNPAMKEFLTTVMEKAYETTQFKKLYNEAIEKAVKKGAQSR